MGEPIRHTTGRRRWVALCVALGAVVVLTLLVLAFNTGSDPASAASGGPEMALNIKGGNCDQPVRPTACSVPAGGTFTLSVDALGIPAGGYTLMQTYIDYGGTLIYRQQAIEDEIKWPDLDLRTDLRTQPQAGHIVHGGLTSLGPPYSSSLYTGTLVEILLTCPGASGSQTTVDLLPYNDPVAQTLGSVYSDGSHTIPKVGSLTINCVAPTPTPAPLQPEMRLNIKGGDCDQPVRPTKCSAPAGGTFTLSVDALGIPAGGYTLIQTYVDYGGTLIYKQQAIEDEIKWPDLDLRTDLRTQPQAGHVVHGGLTNLGPPYPASLYTGTLVEILLTCPGASGSQTTVDLLPYNDPVAQTLGSVYSDGTHTIPKVGSLTINCVAPTPTPTAGPGLPPEMVLNIKGGDCNDAVQPSECHVGIGDTFTLSVTTIGIPDAGYALMQTYIDYGSGLTYKPEPNALDEIVWPDLYPNSVIRSERDPNTIYHGGLTALVPPFPASHHVGNVVRAEFTCPSSGISHHVIELLPEGHPMAGTSGALFLEAGSLAKIVPTVGSLTVHCSPLPTATPTPDLTDTDGDGCPDQRENGPDPMRGGQRDWQNYWDFYDVLGLNGGPPDSIIDLPNDILGVILHFSPFGYSPNTPSTVGNTTFDAFDRGPRVGGGPYNMTAPDGFIDLPNDILGVILQFGHNCQ